MRARDIRQYDGTQTVRNMYVRYTKYVLVVRCTLQLGRLLPASGPGFIIISERKSVRRHEGIDVTAVGSCSHGAEEVS